MKKRIAYIGLSSPLFWDQNNSAPPTKYDRYYSGSDTYDSPNPVYESPFGMLLLYDELWFLCKSLCPKNMRDLPYVKYLDEMYEDIPYEALYELAYESDTDLCNYADRLGNDAERFLAEYLCGINFEHKVQLRKCGIEETYYHQLIIDKLYFRYSSKSVNLLHLYFDIYLLKYLSLEIELIPNIENAVYLFGSDYFNSTQQRVITNNSFAELVSIPNIPNFITKDGPYHPCIEEARDDKYIKYFRQWIQENKFEDKTEVCEAVMDSINRVQNDLFLKWLDPARLYKSVGKNILLQGVDLVIPFYSSLLSLYEEIKGNKSAKSMRWAGFIINARNRYFTQ